MPMIPFLHKLAAHPLIPIFLFLNLVIGFWAHRKAKVNSFEDYALASRSLPTGVLVMTLLGTILSTTNLSFPDYAYSYGILIFLDITFILVPFLLVGTFVVPHLVYFRSSNSIGDLMDRFYGRTARLVSGVIGVFIAFVMIGSQLRAIGNISEILLDMDYSVAILCFGIVVVIYSVWGGIRAVSYTDVLQIVATLLVFIWLLQIVIQKVGGAQLVFEGLRDRFPTKLRLFDHPRFFYRLKAASVWGLSCTYIFTPPIVQRMLMVQEKRKVRKMFYVGGLFYAFICLILVFIGLSIIVGQEKLGLSGKLNDLILGLVQLFFPKQSWGLNIMFIGILGVLISTMDSFLHAVGIVFVRDILEPIKALLGKGPSSDRQQIIYTKVGTALIGIFAILLSLSSEKSLLVNKNYALYIISGSALIIIPLILGIIGIKTDKASWISFCVMYLAASSVLKWRKWEIYDLFLVTLPLATLAYFLTHIIKNRGIVTLKRSKLTVSERLWLPSWSGCKKKIAGWLKAPLHLPTLAGRKVVNTPTHSLAFSMLIFGLYTLSSLFSNGGADAANFMAGIHLVGITLCAGLMLEGIWPAKLKPYFALYWFFTLFYCLPLGGTLTFLRVYEGNFAFVLFLASFILLGYLVDSKSFFTIGLLGFFSAVGIYKLSMGTIPKDFWYQDATIKAFSVLALLAISIFLFGRSKEARTKERLYWNRIASSILGHDVRGSAQMLGGAGNVLEKTFEIGEPITNVKGEKGYWLPFAQSKFLAQYSTDMTRKAADTRKEIANFLAFIKSQIMGTFEQEGVSMRTMAEEGVGKLKEKVSASHIQITLEAAKDFEAKVLAGIFPNVISNLLMNAISHGKATEVNVKIDGGKRTITVWDNGEGIPADVLPHIFDLSYSTASPGKENAGVGLAFVKMVLDASAAKISCHSRVGKGSFTKFEMTFA